MKQFIAAIVATILLANISNAREGQGGARELRGRDIVKAGETTALTGVLSSEGEEWQLTVGETVYNIHLGPSFYREEKGIELKDGQTASLTGYLKGTDVAVSTLKLGETTYTLRDATGRPAWAGRGRSGGGRNRRGQGKAETCTKERSETCSKEAKQTCTKAGEKSCQKQCTKTAE